VIRDMGPESDFTSAIKPIEKAAGGGAKGQGMIDAFRKREALTISCPGSGMASLRLCAAGPRQKSRKQPHAK
jgi:hypothetical protein